MKYLLFVYGNYSNHEFILKQIAKVVATVSCKDVKYQFAESGAIYHFTTLEKPTKVKKELTQTLMNFSAMYFLVPLTKNVNFYIGDENIHNHLFSETDQPDNMSVNMNLEYDLNDIKNDVDKINIDQFMQNLSNFIGVDLTKIPVTEEEINETCPEEPSLDELLDKISKDGIDSLTDNEKQLLNEYSKG